MAAQLAKARDHLKSHMLFESEAHSNNPDGIRAFNCGSAWKKDPGSGVIGVEKGPLIPVV